MYLYFDQTLCVIYGEALMNLAHVAISICVCKHEQTAA